LLLGLLLLLLLGAWLGQWMPPASVLLLLRVVCCCCWILKQILLWLVGVTSAGVQQLLLLPMLVCRVAACYPLTDLGCLPPVCCIAATSESICCPHSLVAL
jgi:hypothetical protein